MIQLPTEHLYLGVVQDLQLSIEQILFCSKPALSPVLLISANCAIVHPVVQASNLRFPP